MMLTDSHSPEPLHLHGIILPEGIEKDVFVVNGHITFQPRENAFIILKSGYFLPGFVTPVSSNEFSKELGPQVGLPHALTVGCISL